MKNRGIAIVLALLLGGIGVHRFYVGRIGSGFLMLLFFWTYIPVLIAIYDAICFASMGEERFQKKYSSV